MTDKSQEKYRCHTVCNKHLKEIGDKAQCCECVPHNDCEFSYQSQEDMVEVEYDKDGNPIKANGVPLPISEKLADWEEKIIDKLAYLEHEQWIEWSKQIAKTEKISPERLARWRKMWVAYDLLTEEQKEQDKKYARKLLPIIRTYIQQAQKEAVNKIINKLVKIK